jgi:NAD(P)-dependent dehydrogenase (short-subunit alcohol dehydrogenase family)
MVARRPSVWGRRLIDSNGREEGGVMSQTVVITGGTGGIGSALARLLASRGDNLALMARRPEPLAQLVAELGGEERVVSIAGDVTNPEDLGRLVQETKTRFGRIDGLAHCVGSILLKPLHAASLDDLMKTLEINLVSAFLACKAVIPTMREQRSGSIVLCSTVAVGQGLNNHEIIAAAKGGVEGLVRSAAVTYARLGIRFNAVAPGLTDTPLASFLTSNETMKAASEAMHPMGRIGRPEDVAAALAFLLGEDSSWITGQILGVDGGLGAGLAPPKVATRG